MAQQKNDSFQVLDIGAGTGLLSLMLAQQFNKATFTGVELDTKAAEQAQVNCVQSPWGNCINIVEGDILTFNSPSAYDLIISNPPFYENDLKATSLKKNLAFHNNGIKLGQLLIRINELLKPGGMFFLLLPPKREADLLHWCEFNELSIQASCHLRSTAKKSISRVFYRGCKSNNFSSTITDQTQLIVQGNNMGYSEEAYHLLADYYLTL
jgi:tRNA1Val (adenine37-N6)-methyltransferase